MGEIVVSTFLRVLLGRVKSSSDDDQLKHLATSLQRLAEMVEVVEKWQTSDSRTGSWLLQVESALFDIDDMLDEVKMGGAALFKPHLKLAQTYKIKTVRRVVDEIEKAGGSCALRKRFQPSISDPDEPVPSMVGRESDKSRIIDLIVASVEKYWNVTVVPIVGFMGIGKTALAQSIYLDPRIHANFDLKLWVRLAGESVPDVFDILKQVTLLVTQDQDRDPWSLTEMKTELVLRHKKLFIVLDDCQEDHLRLALTRELVDLLPGGSAIIMTSRSERVASLFGTVPAHQLGGLSLDDSCELFRLCASASSNRIATEILKLCRGIPSVVQAIGAFLSSKRDAPGQWDKELSRLQDGTGKDITRYLTFDCYDRLPSHLKQLVWTFHLQTSCRLTVDELICLWMALGFLSCDLDDSDDPTQQPEHVARKYLKELAKTALFTNVGYAPGGFIRDLDLDDLVYDVATSRARNQVRVHGHSSSKQDYSAARYSIWDTVHIPGEALPSSLPNANANANKTRLFMLCHGRQASEQLVRDVVSGFKCLRVLGLGGSDIQMLPDSIGSLKHLRYLDVGRNARMKRLPDSICKLWNLQTLFLSGCRQLEQIPENIGRLQNLRYLTLTTLQASLPEKIGQLSSLRTLGLASCTRLASLPRSIKNLRSLETLGIVDCQVFDLGASSVDGLKWGNGGTLLLSGLPKLEHFPAALGHASVSLKHLMIQSCDGLRHTIWIHQLRSLSSLTIEDCPNLSDLADGSRQFNNTVELVIRGCPSLANTAWIKQFMSLRSLVIDACPSMVALDDGFAGLKYLERLEIRRCPHLTNRCVSPLVFDQQSIISSTQSPWLVLGSQQSQERVVP